MSAQRRRPQIPFEPMSSLRGGANARRQLGGAKHPVPVTAPSSAPIPAPEPFGASVGTLTRVQQTGRKPKARQAPASAVSTTTTKKRPTVRKIDKRQLQSLENNRLSSSAHRLRSGVYSSNVDTALEVARRLGRELSAELSRLLVQNFRLRRAIEQSICVVCGARHLA